MAINTLFENIADAIRDVNDSSDSYTPDQMPEAIRQSGEGNMKVSVYDADETVKDAGGIVSYVAGQISGKADSDDVYTKTQTDGLLADKANSADVYTKTQTDDLLSSKANSADVYTKTEADNLLSSKANSADVYTKTATDDLLDAKTNISTITELFDVNTSYAAGDYFIDNNIIYHVDVPCTGITPPNTNYYTPNKLTDFIKANSSQISNLNTVESTEVTDFGVFYKCGKMVMLVTNFLTDDWPNNYQIATAPYLPHAAVFLDMQSVNTKAVAGTLVITTDGRIQTFGTSVSGGGRIQMTLTYLSA